MIPGPLGIPPLHHATLYSVPNGWTWKCEECDWKPPIYPDRHAAEQSRLRHLCEMEPFAWQSAV